MFTGGVKQGRENFHLGARKDQSRNFTSKAGVQGGHWSRQKMRLKVQAELLRDFSVFAQRAVIRLCKDQENVRN